MKQLVNIEKEKQLLVEGNDYRNFFEAFCKELQIRDIQIRDFGGVTDLFSFLSAFVNLPRFNEVRSIGIVRDAELSESKAMSEVSRSLKKNNLTVPQSVGQNSVGLPSVTVLILPGEGCPGMLETLICQTIAETGENACIDDYFDCLDKLPTFSNKRPEKARVHAWLATKPDPHVSVGIAAKKGYIDFEHGAMWKVKNFLISL